VAIVSARRGSLCLRSNSCTARSAAGGLTGDAKVWVGENRRTNYGSLGASTQLSVSRIGLRRSAEAKPRAAAASRPLTPVYRGRHRFRSSGGAHTQMLPNTVPGKHGST
jgi:hypothetical protein